MIPGTLYGILEAPVVFFRAVLAIDYFYRGLGVLCFVSQGFFPSVAGLDFMAEICLK